MGSKEEACNVIANHGERVEPRVSTVLGRTWRLMGWLWMLLELLQWVREDNWRLGSGEKALTDLQLDKAADRDKVDKLLKMLLGSGSACL